MVCSCCSSYIDYKGISNGLDVFCMDCFYTDKEDFGIEEIDGSGKVCEFCGLELDDYFAYDLCGGGVICEECLDKAWDEPEKYGLERVSECFDTLFD